MKNKIVRTKNLLKLGEECETLAASTRSQRIGVVHGDTGLGKTTGLTWYGVRIARAPCVRALELWNPGYMLRAIGRELDIEVSRELAKAVEEIIAELARRNVMLMFDEADYIVDKPRLINTVRDIADIAQTPILLAGMGEFAKKLRARLDQAQFSGRIAFELEFQRLDEEDMHLMAKELLEGVKIDDALLKKLQADCEGNARLVREGLQRIETFANVKGLDKVTAEKWGAQPLNFMMAPERRQDRKRIAAAA